MFKAGERLLYINPGLKKRWVEYDQPSMDSRGNLGQSIVWFNIYTDDPYRVTVKDEHLFRVKTKKKHRKVF